MFRTVVLSSCWIFWNVSELCVSSVKASVNKLYHAFFSQAVSGTV